MHYSPSQNTLLDSSLTISSIMKRRITATASSRSNSSKASSDKDAAATETSTKIEDSSNNNKKKSQNNAVTAGGPPISTKIARKQHRGAVGGSGKKPIKRSCQPGSNGKRKWWWWLFDFDRGVFQWNYAGAFFGAVAMTLAALMKWNNPQDIFRRETSLTSSVVDPHVERLIQMAAVRSASASASLYCHSDIQTRSWRTQVAVRRIPSQTVVLRIPRHDVITDQDALRNSFVREELFSARRYNNDYQNHDNEELPLPADVFLAAHLARLIKWYSLDKKNSKDDAFGHDRDNSHHEGIRGDFDDLNDDQHSEFLRHYLTSVLPTHTDYVSYHPVLSVGNGPKQADLLLRKSMSMAAYDLVEFHLETLTDSYDALCRASTRFGHQISRNEFNTALLHVWTRSFGTGPSPRMTGNQLQQEQDNITRDDDNDEFEFYKQEVGVDLSQGSFAMVPILDLYNHHANPNVGFQFDKVEQAFVVTSIRSLQVGQEIRDSYGKHTEAHLFAKYGFMNGDGSDHTQASLALFHPVYSHGLPFALLDHGLVDSDELGKKAARIQAQRLIRYLHNDDGYENCIEHPPPSSSETTTTTTHADMVVAFEFKRLKLQHLMEIAHVPQRWMVFLTPRNPKAKPPLNKTAGDTVAAADDKSNQSELKIPRFLPSQVQVDANPIMSTCRLIVMTHRDYNQTATRLLRDHFSSVTSSSKPFDPPPTKKDALQYRELMCVLRLCQMAFQMYNTTVDEQMNLVRSLTREKNMLHNEQQSVSAKATTNSNESVSLENQQNKRRQQWMMAHVKLAELQALQVLRDNAMKWMVHLLRPEYDNPRDLLNSAPEYTLRNAPCPWKYQEALLETVY